MSAVISKNEATAAKRRALMTIVAVDGVTGLWRGSSTTGRLYVGKSVASLTAASGTATNVRRAFVIADDVIESVDTANDRLTLTAHGLQTGDGPVRFSNSGGALPTGIVGGTDYWVIKYDTDKISIASSLANAYIGTKVDITAAGSGTNTLQDTASTERGIDGAWLFEFAQAETNVDGSELTVTADVDPIDFSATAATDNCLHVAHGLVTGNVVFLSTTNTLPAGLSTSTPYWVIRVDADNFRLATSFANALTGTQVDITSTGTGVHYVEPFFARATTSVSLFPTVQGFETVIEGSYTAADILRLLTGVLAGKVANFTTGTLAYKSLDGTKTRLTVTTDATGRLTITVGDLT